METSDYVIGICGFITVLALIFGVPYGAYKYGRFAERRLLTQVFSQMTSDTYYQGYDDGFREGHKPTKCPTLDQLMDKEDEDGRY